LSEIARGFKTFSAGGINVLRGRRGAPVWQRGFYEHVIRSDADRDRVRRTMVYESGLVDGRRGVP
jgi:putative transposase